MSSTSYYSCSGKYSTYDKLEVDFPEEPSCITMISIASNKREAIANYNQCLEDLKTYASQLDEWIKCKNEKALEYAKQREQEIVDVYNTSLEEAKQHIESKASPDNFYPTKYMDDNHSFYNTCSVFITTTDQCTFPLPEIPYCLKYNGFKIDSASSCLYEVQSWQAELKDWLKKQSEANIEIAKEKLKRLTDDLRLQGNFL